MDARVLLVLFTISCFWCCNARDLAGLQALHVEEVNKNDQLCTLCDQYTAEALDYLSENKTQTEIINLLHQSCSKMHSFSQQCFALVDYYAPLFFKEVSSINAEDFCQKFGLCRDVSTSQELSFAPTAKDKCELCQNVITEALVKLKDPDTELEILQLLLKACNSAGKNVKKCKKLVFEYAPVILVNAEEFLEKNDVCTILHACDATASSSEQVSLGTETSMHAAS